jgi:hypothetical protein
MDELIDSGIAYLYYFPTATNMCLEVGVEDSIVNASRITDHGSAV